MLTRQRHVVILRRVNKLLVKKLTLCIGLKFSVDTGNVKNHFLLQNRYGNIASAGSIPPGVTPVSPPRPPGASSWGITRRVVVGLSPTGMVATTLLVVLFITDTVFEPWLDT